MLEDGLLSMGHARALLSITNQSMQLEAAKRVVDAGLSVRQTEALAARLMKAPTPQNTRSDTSVDYAAVMSTQLGQLLGRKVHIVDGRKRGKIELEYYGAEDREALLQALMTLRK